MWSRLTTRSIRAINAVHRRALILKRQVARALGKAAPYLIGIPLMLAVPAGGVILGLRLAHDPKFAAGKASLVDPLITAGFFLVGAFFTAERAFGLLGAIGIAGFLALAIFLLCAKLIGALTITAVRGDRRRQPAVEPTPASAPDFAEPDDGEAEVADLDMQAFLRR